jgi:hypothetical protein
MDEMTWLFKVCEGAFGAEERTHSATDVPLARTGLHHHDYLDQSLNLDLLPAHLRPHPMGYVVHLYYRRSLRLLGHLTLLDSRVSVQSCR